MIFTLSYYQDYSTFELGFSTLAADYSIGHENNPEIQNLMFNRRSVQLLRIGVWVCMGVCGCLGIRRKIHFFKCMSAVYFGLSTCYINVLGVEYSTT